MSVRNLLCAAAALALFAPMTAIAKEKDKEKKVEHERTCVCTMGQPGMPPMPPMPGVAPAPGAFMFHVPAPPPDGKGGVRVFRERDGEVQILRDGDDDEDRIIIYRTTKRHDGADANRDGKITRREFLAKAEARFKKLDANDDGVLTEEEAEPHPMPFTMPLPPTPPAPPVPPTPPAPKED